MKVLQWVLGAIRYRATNACASPRVHALILLAVAAVVCWRLWPRAVRLEGVTIQVTRLGTVDEALVRGVAEGISDVYGIPCSASPDDSPLPNEALDGKTGKYQAEVLLEELARLRSGQRVHRLGLTDADVSVEDWNFVFGLAEMPGRVAVMSVAKLRPKRRSADADRLLRERAVKIAVHELGHTFGFRHCPDERCVMSYTETAAGVDRTDATFCARCAARFRR